MNKLTKIYTRKNIKIFKALDSLTICISPRETKNAKKILTISFFV